MAETHTLNITLSIDALQFVQEALATGQFASESEVLESGLNVLQGELEKRSRWEREIVLPAFHRLNADPSPALSLQQVEAGLQHRRDQRARQIQQADVL